jgi:hypothetical protein
LKRYIIAFLTFEPLHIHRMTLLTSSGVFLCLMYLSFQGNKSRQTVKLTLYDRATAPLPDPMQSCDHTTSNNKTPTLRARYPDVRSSKQTKPPAYLFRYFQCQRATQRQKPDQCALTSGAPALINP